MSYPSVSRITMSSPDLNLRLSRVIDLLDRNAFQGLNFVVHHEIDNKPTVVLTGTYESRRDKDLFFLLNGRFVKNLVPENIVVEWSHRDEAFPDKTVLETHPLSHY